MSEAPRIVRLDPAAYRRTPWKNGGGVTVDIADAYRQDVVRQDVAPGAWTGMLWRFGRTRIARPGPFSDLSGYDRILAVVEGMGLVLRRTGDIGGELDVRQPYQPVRFPGEWALTSTLEDGPVEVLNLIGERASTTLDLRFVEAPGAVEAGRGDHVVYAPDGEADVRVLGETVRLPDGHAVRFATAARVGLAVVAGRVALASIGPRDLA